MCLANNDSGGELVQIRWVEQKNRARYAYHQSRATSRRRATIERVSLQPKPDNAQDVAQTCKVPEAFNRLLSRLPALPLIDGSDAFSDSSLPSHWATADLLSL